MSAVTTKNTRNRYTVEKTNNKKGGGKFCKICKDTGKSLAEYTSHYVRETPDPNSRVVCPTLISAVCRYCKEGGHTAKHCPKIRAKHYQQDDQSHIISKDYCMSTNDKKKNKTNNKETVKCSAFSVLDDYDSSDNEDEVVTDTVDTPPPPSPDPNNTTDVNSYANILRNGPPPPPPVQQKEIVERTTTVSSSQVDSLIPTKLDFSGEIVEPVEKVDEVVTVTLFDISGNWADDEDLDDALTFDFLTERPVFSYNDHPLHYYNNKMISSIVNKYTNGYTKKIRITEDAFKELFQKWDTEFFTENDASGTLKKTMNMDPRSNFQSRAISLLTLFTR